MIYKNQMQTRMSWYIEVGADRWISQIFANNGLILLHGIIVLFRFCITKKGQIVSKLTFFMIQQFKIENWHVRFI